jgi:chorismate-pyruvate lyase
MTTLNLPLRMLVGTDGSLTALLEASFEAPVEVRTVANTVDGRLPTPAELDVDEGAPMLERVTRILSSGRPLAVVTERIPATIFDAL